LKDISSVLYTTRAGRISRSRLFC